MEIIKTTDFYQKFQSWIDTHSFDEYGRPLYNNGKNKGQVIRGSIRGGYPYINLSHNGKRCAIALHRIVAYLFIPNTDTTKNIVNHIDGNKLNFKITNLEWVTQKENVIHAVTNNLTRRPNKSIIATNLSTKKQYQFISLLDCSKFFNKHPSTISAWCTGYCNSPKDWLIQYKENQRFVSNLSERNIKEHPKYKGYFLDTDSLEVISTVRKHPKILKLLLRENGYYQVALAKYKIQLWFHRFIWECVNQQTIPSNYHIDHMDSNPKNNSIDNLQLLSAQENIAKANVKTIIVEYTNNKIEYYKSASEFGKVIDLPQARISEWLTGKVKSYKKYNIKRISFKE